MKSKVWLIVSILCIVAGIGLFLASGVRDGGDLVDVLGKAGYAERPEEKSVTVTDPFHSISVKTGSDDVQLLPSGDGSCRVVYGETDHSTYKVSVKGNTLTIEREDDNSLLRNMTLYSESVPVRIYLPERSYEQLLIETASGDVHPEAGFAFQKVQINTASGEAELSELQAESLQINTASGDVTIERCTLGAFKLETGSGDVEMTGCVCTGEGSVSTASGEISLRSCDAGSLRVSSASGEILLQETLTTGATRAETASGDIELVNADAASFRLEAVSGDISGTILTAKDFKVETVSGSVHTSGDKDGAGECRVSTVSGSVDLSVRG